MAVVNVKSERAFSFDPDELLALGARLAREYAANQPFPHLVVDDFLPPAVLDEILQEWPDFASTDWTTYDNSRELKHVCSQLGLLGPTTQAVLQAFNSSAFVRFLQVLTGIVPLLVDPHFQAAGVFDVQPGGFLDLHTDFTECPHSFDESEWVSGFWDHYAGGTGLARRVNVLLYLNRDWKEENGGALEFWSSSPFERATSILPVFNRLAIFSTLPDAVHGHPQPVSLPAGQSRKCLSTYYYTKERPIREVLYGRHTVMFDEGARPPRHGKRGPAMTQLLLPPIAWRGARRLRSKLLAQRRTSPASDQG